MRFAIAAAAILLSASASAETIEVKRVAPVDGSVCPMSQQIIILRCVRATTIDCEEPGAPVDFECVRGVAFPAGARPKPPLIVKKEVIRVPVRVPVPVPVPVHVTHRMPTKSILDLLFHLHR